MTSVSQMKPTTSMISRMTGRSYISLLHKKLKQEQEARVDLENELNELKQISSQMASALSEFQKSQLEANNNQ